MTTYTQKQVQIHEWVDQERARQDRKWGREFQGRNHAFWLAILMEEVGEAAQAVLEFPYDENGYNNLQEELIQSAAVIFSWLEFFDDAIAGDIRTT